jgi:hypothetical protein
VPASPRKRASSFKRDVLEFLGMVVKTAPRQITIYLNAPSIHDAVTDRITTPFEA